jgi:hypothetical protein
MCGYFHLAGGGAHRLITFGEIALLLPRSLTANKNEKPGAGARLIHASA